jgi:hypothetical protein
MSEPIVSDLSREEKIKRIYDVIADKRVIYKCNNCDTIYQEE